MKNFDYDHQDTRKCKSMDLGKKLQKKKQLFFAFWRSNNSLFEMAKRYFFCSVSLGIAILLGKFSARSLFIDHYPLTYTIYYICIVLLLDLVRSRVSKIVDFRL